MFMTYMFSFVRQKYVNYPINATINGNSSAPANWGHSLLI